MFFLVRMYLSAQDDINLTCGAQGRHTVLDTFVTVRSSHVRWRTHVSGTKELSLWVFFLQWWPLIGEPYLEKYEILRYYTRNTQTKTDPLLFPCLQWQKMRWSMSFWTIVLCVTLYVSVRVPQRTSTLAPFRSDSHTFSKTLLWE